MADENETNDAYQAGQQAFKDNLIENDNPHYWPGREHFAWLRGFRRECRKYVRRLRDGNNYK